MTDVSRSYVDDLLDMKDDDAAEKRSEFSEIARFFAGTNVLVTGGTGFLGTLLVEKLLRCCPDIATLFMLMRPKKGKSPEERFKTQFDNVIFDRLTRERPNFRSKVVLVEGDLREENLGLTAEGKKALLSTNVIFHAAATVRFDETLRTATNINVMGTKDLITFAKQIPDLKAFVYISTAYSNCVLKRIEERHYTPPMTAEDLIKLTQILDDEKLLLLKDHLIGKWPNTYAYTKAITEDMVRKYSVGVPTCIVRPSIMIATSMEPIGGWIDNLYGPTGVFVGAAMGLLRSLQGHREKSSDLVPADYVISSIVAAAWDTGVRGKKVANAIADSDSGVSISDIERVPIYNVVSSCQSPLLWGEYMDLNEECGKQVPSPKVFWYYWLTLQHTYWAHVVARFFLHIIPAAIVDAVAIVIGRKPMLLKAYKKIHKFITVISYFSTHEWIFNNDATLALLDRMNPTDRTIFNFDFKTLDWRDYTYRHIRGIRVYLLGDPMESLPEGQAKVRKLFVAHYSIVAIVSLLVLWIAVSFLKILWAVFVH